MSEQKKSYWVKLADGEREAGNYQKAIEYYRRTIDRQRTNYEAYIGLGISEHNLGNDNRARQYYKLAIEENPKEARGYYYLGLILIQCKKTRKGIKSLDICVGINEDIAMAYYYLCMGLTSIDEQEASIETIEQKICRDYPVINKVHIETYTLQMEEQKYKCDETMIDKLYITLAHELNGHKFVCFGDSHRSVFNNIKNVECFNVGSGTAYNLINNESKTGAGKKVKGILLKEDPENTIVILAFGEIDCMEHMYKNYFKGIKGMNQLMRELVENYMKFVNIITKMGYTCLLYGPAFSGKAFNSYGSIKDRNKLVKSFNEELKNKVENDSMVYHYSLSELMIDNCMEPRLEMSKDKRHLDEFPEGSREIQSIIMKGYLDEKKRKGETNRKINQEFDKLDKVNCSKEIKYIIVEKTEKNADVSEKGTGVPKRITLMSRDAKEWGIIFCLQDYIRIEEVQFHINKKKSTDSGMQKIIKVEVEMYGLDDTKVIAFSETLNRSLNGRIIAKGYITRMITLTLRRDITIGKDIRIGKDSEENNNEEIVIENIRINKLR